MTVGKRPLVAYLLAGVVGGAAWLGAQAAPPQPLPYRLWWSFPNDNDSAIEVAEADLSVSKYESRWQFAVAMQKCDAKKSKRLAEHKDGTPVREIRIESLEPDGSVRSTARCTMALKDWRTRIGVKLVERLEDELDAHMSFLMPRRFPGMPARMTADGGVPPPADAK